MIRTKVIYVSGEFGHGDGIEREQKIEKIKEASDVIWERGFVPLFPYFAVSGKSSNFSFDEVLDSCLDLVGRCDAMYMLPGWSNSERAQRERERAIQRKKWVFYDLVQIEKWDSMRNLFDFSMSVRDDYLRWQAEKMKNG
jgi:hypothetical protein